MAMLKRQTMFENTKATSFCEDKANKYVLTPFIVTLLEGPLTDIDIQNFLEAGLRIIRFKMSHMIETDILVILSRLRSAVKNCCEKYFVATWPVAVIVDLPNACIRTGYIRDDIPATETRLKKDSIVEVTCETKYWNKCDSRRIFIDDPHTIKTIKPDTEISINFGTIQMVCTEVVDEMNIKCKVTVGGILGSAQFVCIRDLKYKRPSLTKYDKRLISFVKEHKIDAIIINSIRSAATITKVRNLFTNTAAPLIICSICEQEGLNNFDSILELSDGILLAREFLSEAITYRSRLAAIQSNIGAKCKKAGKPFFISGHIFEETMVCGDISPNELSDVTNAMLQSAGLVLSNYEDAGNVLSTINIIHALSRSIESISKPDNLSKMSMELKPPVNAAFAAVLGCAIAARQTGSKVIVLLTVTGSTAVQLSRVASDAIILTVSTNPMVARQLQLYRGVVPIIYDSNPKDSKTKKNNDWYTDMKMRILYAIKYGLRYDFLKYGHSYVVLRKAKPTSPYCDQVSVWKVKTEQFKTKRIDCGDK